MIDPGVIVRPVIVRRPIGDSAPEATLYYGADCREALRGLPEQSVHTVVTSPPYWGLRDYGTGDAQIGLENSPEEFVANLVEVFREVHRVLRDDGTLWLNLGDSYAKDGQSGLNANSGTSTLGPKRDGLSDDNAAWERSRPRQTVPAGLKSKDLVGIPWMVAFALRADGWYLRSDIIWAKSSCMPESIRDRPTKSHEYLFLLSKQPRYFYDSDAIREPSIHAHRAKDTPGTRSNQPSSAINNRRDSSGGVGYHENGRNKRTVWNVNPRPYPGAHFAVFPPDLITPCVLAGTSEKGCCPECGAPWERVIERGRVIATGGSATGARASNMDSVSPLGQDPEKSAYNTGAFVQREHVTKGWEPTCECGREDTVPCKVLDPFSGSATSGLVALDHGREYVGLDLSSEYLDLARARILGERPPTSDEVEKTGILEFFS